MNISQHDFYELVAVQQQLRIQKTNKYGSSAHKAAHERIGELAKENGVWAEYVASSGGLY